MGWRLRAAVRVGAVVMVCVAGLTTVARSEQATEALPDALTQMVETERAFAARALVAGWKQAFLDYFSNAAIGFADGKYGPAKEQIRGNPDPPKDHQLLWEPRLGDVSGSGEIGYLTGPSRSVQPSRDNGRPRHSVYTSVWKRQRDGSFQVVLDVGIPTPSTAPFAAGFVRAPHGNRFTGDYDDTTPPLVAADGVLNSGLRSDPARAYRGQLSSGARFHRPNLLPLVGEARIGAWLATQPAFLTANTGYAESARSGDLGYSWGAYTTRGRTGAADRGGFYVRIWVRERSGQWKVALDVLQPQ